MKELGGGNFLFKELIDSFSRVI